MLKMPSPPLIKDFYKISHREQYPSGTELVYSTWTPRASRIPGVTEVICFGVQGFISEFLIDYMQEYFFSQPIETILKEYVEVIRESLSVENPETQHIEDLHALGYLPIEIKALAEGTRVPIRVPYLTIQNTLPQFFWLTNSLETVMSIYLWKSATSATIADDFAQMLKKYENITNAGCGFWKFQGHDFSMRGFDSVDAAARSGAGHLLSFLGTDTIPAICYLKTHYDAVPPIAFSIPACYDSKTEILTDKGFKKFKDLNKTEKVAEYKSDGTIVFTKPTAYVAEPYKGKMVQFSKPKGHSYIDCVVTPNHKMVRLKNNSLELFEAGDFSYRNRSGYSNQNKILLSGEVKSSKKFTDLDALKIAFQADGSFPSHKEDYTGERSKAFPIRFSLKKEKKKNRLEKICKNLGLDYTLNKHKNGYYSFWINTPEQFYKDFSWVEIETLSSEYCQDFITELQHWDGNSKANCIIYSTTNKICIDVLQAIAALANCKTLYNSYLDKREDRQLIHSLIFQLGKNWVLGNGVKRNIIDYDDYIYCVSVPSKMIITRRNNVVLVCGNTEHSVQCAYEDDDVAFEQLLTRVYPSGFVSIVSDTWDLWDVIERILPKYKDVIMARDGKVVIRPDSSKTTPQDIICGLPAQLIPSTYVGLPSTVRTFADAKTYAASQLAAQNGLLESNKPGPTIVSDYFEFNSKFYEGVLEIDFREMVNYPGEYYIHATKLVSFEETNNPELRGVVQCLWDIFGGTVNNQGYKVLDSHIGAIYGDAITKDRGEEICQRLMAKGFASSNIVFGIGSFTYVYNTRDTFGFALKSTLCVKNGREVPIFKKPKTDDGTKFSQKGRVAVLEENGKLIFKDGLSLSEVVEDNLLKTVYKDGELLIRTNLQEIRRRLQHD